MYYETLDIKKNILLQLASSNYCAGGGKWALSQYCQVGTNVKVLHTAFSDSSSYSYREVVYEALHQASSDNFWLRVGEVRNSHWAWFSVEVPIQLLLTSLGRICFYFFPQSLDYLLCKHFMFCSVTTLLIFGQKADFLQGYFCLCLLTFQGAWLLQCPFWGT